MTGFRYRYLLPNAITFVSLSCGVVSILLSANGYLFTAGILILSSYLLDVADGAVARGINASTAFGLQLDSLVDMVSLGTAPAVLCFAHLQNSALNMYWVWPMVVLLPLAGAFRLARFNLMPPKTNSDGASIGLTISTGGAFITLAVLSDLSLPGRSLPPVFFLVLLAIIIVLMVSRFHFPAFTWVFSSPWRLTLLLVLIALSIISMPPFIAWFLWTLLYLVIGLVRILFYQSRSGKIDAA